MNTKVVLLFVSFIFLTACSYRTPTKSQELSYWHWHSPYAPTSETLQDLRAKGVKRVFVRAGTISNDGKKLVLVMPQTYVKTQGDLPITLVFTFDSGAVSHFEEFELQAMIEGVGSRIIAQVDAAEKAGMTVEGVQLDMDCPTRLLPRYAEFVRGMRQGYLNKRYLVTSTTALFSWLGTDGVGKLSAELDFIVPQAYEGMTGKTIEEARPVSDPEMIRRGLSKADQLQCPYFIGIPAYGRATIYDPQGRLVNILRDLSPQEAFRSPGFTFDSAFPADAKGRPAQDANDWSGEQFLKFRALRPDGNYAILYSIPTAKQTEESLKVVRAHSSNKLKGSIIFRIPEEGEALALPLSTEAGNLDIQAVTQKNNDGMIEGSRFEPAVNLTISLSNTGESTFISDDAVIVDLAIQPDSVENIRPRDAISFEFGHLRGDQFIKADRREATILRFRLSGLMQGEKLQIGPVQVTANHDDKLTIRSRIRNADGFREKVESVPINQQ